MNTTEVYEKLWKCHLQTFGREGRERIYYQWAHDAIAWWINTGRASRPWEAAFCKADPAKLMKFAARRSGSSQEYVEEVTKYLRRYCGLTKEV